MAIPHTCRDTMVATILVTTIATIHPSIYATNLATIIDDTALITTDAIFVARRMHVLELVHSLCRVEAMRVLPSDARRCSHDAVTQW